MGDGQEDDDGEWQVAFVNFTSKASHTFLLCGHFNDCPKGLEDPTGHCFLRGIPTMVIELVEGAGQS